MDLIEIGSDRVTGSTKDLAIMCKKINMGFISVDPDEGASNRAKSIVSKISESFVAHQELGEKFLESYPGAIGAVYLDAFDIITEWRHKQDTIDSYIKRGVEMTNENSWKMHLEASKACRFKVIIKGYVCFDDTFKTKGEWDGKGKLGVPYLLKNGYEQVTSTKSAVLLKRIS